MRFKNLLWLVSVSLVVACGGSGDPQQASGSTSGTSSSGGTTTTTGAGGGGGAGGCTPQLHAKVLSHNSGVVPEGAVGIVTITEQLTATCGTVQVNWTQLQLLRIGAKSQDTSPYCAAPCTSPADWYFLYPRLVQQDGAVIALTDFAPKDNDLALAVATFDKIPGAIVEVGAPITLSLVLDVASPLPSLTVKGEQYYVFPLGMGTVPPNALADVVDDTSGEFMTIAP